MPRRPRLSTLSSDTSTWGKRLAVRAGLSDPAIVVDFGPFTPSPDIGLLQRLVDVRAPTAKPSTTSRNVVAYIVASQVYDNNPNITTALPQRNNPQAVTPLANRRPAFEALFGRLTTSRGGVSSFEEFTIPAHGASLHIGSDTARLEVIFDPGRVGLVDDAGLDNRGKLAAGFSVVGGVASAGFYPDIIRQFFNLDTGTQNFDVPQFSRRMQFVTDAPQGYTFTWLDPFGAPLENVPTSGVSYVDSPQPIPVNAASLRIVTAVLGLAIEPIIIWERFS